MRKTLLAMAVLATTVSINSIALAATTHIKVGQDQLFEDSIDYSGSNDYGIYGNGIGTSGTFTGDKISIKLSSEGKDLTGIYAGNGAKLSLGDRGTTQLNISVTDKSRKSGLFPWAVWVDGNKNSQFTGGELTLQGKSVSISARGNNQSWVRAIHVASNSMTPTSSSKLFIDADTINIVATADGEKPQELIGVSAMSRGEVYITGNTTIIADDAILARGEAIVSINADRKHTTVISGDINFNYDGSTSGSKVDASVEIGLSGKDSVWRGNTKVTWSAKTDDKGQIVPVDPNQLEVDQLRLTITDKATWIPSVVEEYGTTGDAVGVIYTKLNQLLLDDGNINITDKVSVVVENMTGTGTINLATDGTTAGKFNVEDADKNASLSVNLMDTKLEKQLTADEINADQAKKLMANVGGKDADGKNVVATSTAVPEGMVNPAFGIDAAGKTHEASANTLMQSSLELASAAPLALNRIMMNDVRKRLGDIRTTEGTHGAWARYDGGKLSGEGGLENDFHTVQVGIDTVPTADSARMGVAFSYTDSDAEYARGSADMKAYSIAMYGTKVFDNGMFVDVIGRMGTADSDLTVDGQHKGTLDNVVLGVSGEFGWRFDVTNSMYIEPQAELSYAYVNGDKLTLGTAEYEVDSVNSLLGRVGFAAGLKCPSDMGNVYVRASAVHEFLGDSKITGANAGHTNVYEIDGKDTWVEYGLGANFNVTKSTYMWADVERTSGGALDEDWRATVGVRYAW